MPVLLRQTGLEHDLRIPAVAANVRNAESAGGANRLGSLKHRAGQLFDILARLAGKPKSASSRLFPAASTDTIAPVAPRAIAIPLPAPWLAPVTRTMRSRACATLTDASTSLELTARSSAIRLPYPVGGPPDQLRQTFLILTCLHDVSMGYVNSAAQ